jgi:hypothetical protein
MVLTALSRNACQQALMTSLPDNLPEETPGRRAYYDAALICTTLFCEGCSNCLDPDSDLGPDRSFETDGYFILLGDLAFERGWQVDYDDDNYFTMLCPACAKARLRE